MFTVVVPDVDIAVGPSFPLLDTSCNTVSADTYCLGSGSEVSCVLQEFVRPITRGYNPEAVLRLAPYLAQFSTPVMTATRGESYVRQDGRAERSRQSCP